ncbi:class I SAM-dependent methyltransferase [Pseudofrankia inefficax]|uniref:Methyltransferase type 11 n=1 Tax=Pseudofrankia inefficax (strain DSM 45817 / CECT 9037 / DDB 130130 / EuI1c) TaxID=298654 RepID=E3J411_PSEI1|nr:class I SAM-dependent methyltransferase [Pseudofrankia inefficax]ADP80644.1 Methyltransferase type 11 [Pseudofrankia inefficax]
MAGDLFTGTAEYYARHRPGYPPAFLAEIGQRLSLSGAGRLLDLGCGPGTLALALAGQVGEVIGVDPEPDMLAEAARQTDLAGIQNVRWVKAHAEDLAPDLGVFQLVTMGRSFHWMRQDRVLESLAEMVAPAGGLAIVNDSCLVRPETDWQRSVEAIQEKFVGTVGRAGNGVLLPPAESMETVLRRSAFRRIDRIVYEFERQWTVEQIIGYMYSTSVPIRRLLGDRRTSFEKEMTEVLTRHSSDHRFTEPVRLAAYFAFREA